MAEPDLDIEGLVEVGARSAYEALLSEDGKRAPSWNAISEVRKSLWRRDARAILTAVLPRVLRGPREALGPFSDVADDYDDLEEDELQVLVDVDYLAPRLRLIAFRRARSTLSHIDSLLSKGEG